MIEVKKERGKPDWYDGDRKWDYWYLQCTDDKTGVVVNIGKGFTYDKLGEVLAAIIQHEIDCYEKTDGIIEAKLRRKQLMNAMMRPIKREEKRRKNGST